MYGQSGRNLVDKFTGLVVSYETGIQCFKLFTSNCNNSLLGLMWVLLDTDVEFDMEITENKFGTVAISSW